MSLLGRRLAPSFGKKRCSTIQKKSPTNMSLLGNRLAFGNSRRYMSDVAGKNSGLNTTSTYRNFMDAWAKKVHSRAEAAATRLQEWANRRQETDSRQRPKFEPPKMSTQARNALYTWVHSGICETTPEGQLLDDMAQKVRDEKPTLVMYTYLLNALAHSHQPDAGPKALRLLNEMNDRGLPSTAGTYALVLDAWSQSHPSEAVDMAQILLTEVQEKSIPLNAELYRAHMNAWAQSGAFEAGERAEKLLREMHFQGMELSDEIYTAVLSAWARAGMADGYKVEEKTVEEIN